LVWLAALLLILTFNGLKFVRLAADFPPGLTTSRALYTDEGWYSFNAASRSTGGGWYTPGELNTIVNLPVGPLLQRGVFELLGVSLPTARGLVAATSLLLILSAFFLAQRTAPVGAAMGAAVLLSVNFFLFAYSRLAILDLMAATLCIVALAVAVRWPGRDVSAAIAAAIVLGIAALTKTTACCALPPLAYLCATRSRSLRCRIALGGLAVGVYVVVVALYDVSARSQFPVDFRYFEAIAFGFATATGPIDLVRNAATAVFRMFQNQPLTCLAAALLSAAAAPSPSFRKNVLVRACLLWVAGFITMLSLVSYQPSRYFTLIVVPVVMLAAVAAAESPRVPKRGFANLLAPTLVVTILVVNGTSILVYLARPVFSFESMSREVADIVRNDDGVLLGDMSPTISLSTGVPALSMSTGTADFRSRLRSHCPTHFITLREPDETEFKTLSADYALEYVGSWHVFGNYYKGREVQLFRMRPFDADAEADCSLRGPTLMARHNRPLLRRLRSRASSLSRSWRAPKDMLRNWKRRAV
jgi:hypothetical protein